MGKSLCVLNLWVAWEVNTFTKAHRKKKVAVSVSCIFCANFLTYSFQTPGQFALKAVLMSSFPRFLKTFQSVIFIFNWRLQRKTRSECHVLLFLKNGKKIQ